MFTENHVGKLGRFLYNNRHLTPYRASTVDFFKDMSRLKLQECEDSVVNNLGQEMDDPGRRYILYKFLACDMLGAVRCFFQ